MIEVKGLSKYFGERRAVGPLSFQIAEGEVVGLLGLNGAGKTTTLRMLAGDLLPTSGTIAIDGLDLVEEPEKARRRIGFLPDRPPLYGEMRVGEYLSYAARLRGMANDAATRARVAEVARLTALDGVPHQAIGTLSHGYRQRVGIAQAIVHNPGLLLLDEPISGLDPVQIVEMRSLIRSLRGAHTIVISSHILPEVSETCDRILVMINGEVRDAGWQAIRGTIALTVRGDEAKAIAAAESVEGVTRVERLGPAAAEGEPFSLRVAADGDVRERLGRALVGAGVGLIEISRAERQLEALFLEMAGFAARGSAEVRA